MGLWNDYLATVKSVDVEEPIDLWVHRPIAYLLARALYPTPVSPDFVTLMSIVFGVASGVCIWREFPHHMQLGGLLLFASAVVDCADGQLARMRKTSSAWGRALDGSADLVTIAAVAPATLAAIWRMHATPVWHAYLAMALGVATLVTSSWHTTLYDHYKNVLLRVTGPSADADDYEAAAARHAAAGEEGGRPFVRRVVGPIYRFYLKGQRDVVLGYDPYTSTRLTLFPPYESIDGKAFRDASIATMRVWRGLFGFGSLVFGIAFFVAIERPDVYLVLRFVVLNAIFYGWLRPAQRKASREAFRRIGVSLPGQAS